MRSNPGAAIAALLLVLTSGVVMASNDWHNNVKMKSSWPHLTNGARGDMNYDHLIVPGVRIGPVTLGASVTAVIDHSVIPILLPTVHIETSAIAPTK